MAEVKKNVSYITELLNFGHNTIIDCKYKLKNIFTKDISNSDIAVYGEYDIIVFYRHDSRRKSNYEVRTVTRTFAEIIDCSNIFKESSTVKFNNVSFNAKCKINEKDKHHSSSVSYEVDVLGDITLSFNIDKKDVGDIIVEKKRGNTEENIDFKKGDIIKKNTDIKQEINTKKEEKNKGIKEHKETPKFQSEYLDIKDNSEYSIEELMNMGIEELTKLAAKKQ